MSDYIKKGIVTGVSVTICIFLFMGFDSPQEDSFKQYLEQMEELMLNDIAKNIANGRYQLQSFSIGKTHWHYMLDTAKGKLYRMELGRTPDRSRWTLMAEGMSGEPNGQKN